MNFSKSILLPLGAVAIVGACAPYPPAPYPQTNPAVPGADGQQALTDEQQRQIEENRQRLERQEEARRNAANDSSNGNLPNGTSKPDKPKYPTASAVPGKPGFVFNPYTHNIVDVKGIASGKLCRDPEDSDPTHKFRVP
ncbi:MAG: hypothetical protein KJO79_01005 [Verrucomicrobiae bacterium]|nr:hypothetical protein [Verrucomicrobiae bacterium]NNJ85725.1 hypothetical protein [Akkermansiaceae bacterium]